MQRRLLLALTLAACTAEGDAATGDASTTGGPALTSGEAPTTGDTPDESTTATSDDTGDTTGAPADDLSPKTYARRSETNVYGMLSPSNISRSMPDNVDFPAPNLPMTTIPRMAVMVYTSSVSHPSGAPAGERRSVEASILAAVRRGQVPADGRP